jgi:hypothetical protein
MFCTIFCERINQLCRLLCIPCRFISRAFTFSLTTMAARTHLSINNYARTTEPLRPLRPAEAACRCSECLDCIGVQSSDSILSSWLDLLAQIAVETGDGTGWGSNNTCFFSWLEIKLFIIGCEDLMYELNISIIVLVFRCFDFLEKHFITPAD